LDCRHGLARFQFEGLDGKPAFDRQRNRAGGEGQESRRAAKNRDRDDRIETKMCGLTESLSRLLAGRPGWLLFHRGRHRLGLCLKRALISIVPRHELGKKRPG
jgi:hypothetical protein